MLQSYTIHLITFLSAKHQNYKEVSYKEKEMKPSATDLKLR